MSEAKIGPSGGEGGLPIERYEIPTGARIRQIRVTHGWFVDSIQIAYVDAEGNLQALPGIGGHGEHEHLFILDADEYLIGVSGRSGAYVDSIRFHTNKRVSPTYGGAGGEVDFSFLAPEGSEVVGFFGRADWYIDAIGILTRSLPTAVEAAPRAKQIEAAAAPVTPSQEGEQKSRKSKKETPPPASAETGAETTSPASKPAADNLQIIEGIGPKIAELLAQNGITTFADLAATSPEELRKMLLAAGRRFAVTDPTTWPEQAALAAKGDMEALKALQASLKGGRRK
ncbi:MULTISPECIES: DUF4332 domain-containing protein [Caldilinea]|jgi:predicted flap endonuclease-1-like 5' DNA nuclease|uniref:Jacalin-type lectin domain-containing protein n=1 Tax=Caldilinea aerophila (strain DSM 14535 / JCM 11387 / NBRC 104270 / STL-6-O1) TaxID=926550 RepID=I0I6V8_CALAS|nr:MULTISPECIES: DUF4332 domain-containing protein [Caldilinea]MBO9393983.1 DUF4332 domain-containing protein [Caldilinea sp.]BAM00996.1 hypothetical protein CLDAP_29560 [Caldilinea aerophila DSM 14535 = NBRC 104270]GIV72334.1 MAG: hypothetical protein KatS3mg049_0890 [Caldilinea sp.]